MTVAEILGNPELKVEYAKWRELPMTKMAIETVRNETRICTPHPDYIKGEIALVLVGQNSGANNALDRLMELDKVHEAGEELKATFK
jgi:hypothetical protein